MMVLSSRPIRTAAFSPQRHTPIKQSVLKGAPKRWFHVCSVADQTRNGHGITRDELQAYVRDFYRGPEAGPVYLGHQDAERQPGTPEPPAHGWVLALELTKKGDLWALYEMTTELYAEIKRGGYRYNSICGRFISDDQGACKGAEFWSIAVTNTPAVVGLTPMAASRRRPDTKEGRLMAASTNIKDALKKALDELPDDATKEQALGFLDAQMAAQEALDVVEDAPAADAVPVAPADPAPATESLGDDSNGQSPVTESEAPEGTPVALDEGGAMASSALTAVAESAGVDLAAVIAAIQEDPGAFAALVTGEKTPPTPDEQVFTDDVKAAARSHAKALSTQLSASRAEVSALSKRLEELEAQGREREVDDAIEQGLFTDNERERLIRLARNAPSEWAYWLAEAKQAPAVPTGRIVHASRPRGAHFDGVAQSDPEFAIYDQTLRAVEPDDEKRKQLIRDRLAARDR